MEKLSATIDTFLYESEEQKRNVARTAMEAAHIRACFQKAVESIYAEFAPTILDHVNSVRTETRQKGSASQALIVCINDSMIRSDLTSYSELIKNVFHQQGINIDSIRFSASNQNSKTKKPFGTEGEKYVDDLNPKTYLKVSYNPLTKKQIETVSSLSKRIASEAIKKSFISAIAANLELQNTYETPKNTNILNSYTTEDLQDDCIPW